LAEEPARVAALQAEIGWLAYVEERIVESGAAPAAGREPDRNMRSSDCAAWRIFPYQDELLPLGKVVIRSEARIMRSVPIIPLLCCTAVVGSVAGSAQTSNTLQPPSAFVSISDASERSRAIFAEAAKVLTHPRCMNCHPATDRPLQGNDMHPHEPLVTRETSCVTCHTDRNFTVMERASYRSIPGHPRWMVAPIEMAWEGKSVGDLPPDQGPRP
jgi:hypothetical protein